MKAEAFILCVLGVLGGSPLAFAVAPQEQLDFFESRIRPVLVAECFECHSSQKAKGDLKLDFRGGVLAGGKSGPAIVPGRPDQSLLIQAITHQHPKLKMPKDAAKLDDKVIADFAHWVEIGAPDPRTEPPAAADAPDPWAAAMKSRAQWWSFQPLTHPSPPEVKNSAWSDHPVDRFILAKLEETGLTPTKPADRRTLIRRVSFAITGLPPTPEETEAFVGDTSAGAYEKVVDRLLASPQFGERWARHWMDLFRFAESNGSEGDPNIPGAFEYRDYLIRALNADVPYDQLIREHIAGDLLDKPRLNPALGLNESAIGPAHFRMVEHGYAPVDPLDERCKVVENQMDVVAKAFQALTITCARCHNHKFDPISQEDYYALFSVFTSARLTQRPIETPGRLATNVDAMRTLKPKIRAALADAWLASLSDLPARLAALPVDKKIDVADPLQPWLALRDKPANIAAGWTKLADAARAEQEHRDAAHKEIAQFRWDLAGGDNDTKWFRMGIGLTSGVSRPGEFAVNPDGERVLGRVYPAGVYSHTLSSKHAAIYTSPSFKVEHTRISLHLLGDASAQARLVMEDHPFERAAIYKQFTVLDGGRDGWFTWDCTFWKGYTAHIELATASDVMKPADQKNKGPLAPDGRSWFGVCDVLFHDTADVKLKPVMGVGPLLAAQPPATLADLADRYRAVLEDVLPRWKSGTITDAEAAMLDGIISRDILPTTLATLPTVKPLVDEYRKLEAEVPVGRRAPGLMETVGADAHLLVRGDHKNPGQVVPRRYLEVLGSKPFHTTLSGRRELADEIASPSNPLTARVAVNRIWHHLFGRGIVATVDNFGRMGDKPTHPELLDALATRFIVDGWSAKKMIRFLVTSKTYQLDSTPSPRAAAKDAPNDLLSHMRVCRLEAEPIRDSLLAVSGLIDLEQFGPSQPPNGTAVHSTRRSVYTRIQRNIPAEFLAVFDEPKPFTTVGRRDSTNVPAQSLTLLNDRMVQEVSRLWASRMLKDKNATLEGRAAAMFESALGRPPADKELAGCTAFIHGLAAQAGVGDEAIMKERQVWADYALSLFNLKEFIFIR